MLITVLVLIGYAFDFSHEATIISQPLHNASGNKIKLSDEALQTDYVKLQPEAKIYFYTTDDEHLMIGPKLQSEEDVTIFVLNQDEDLKTIPQFKNPYIKQETYSVGKSGVLVPKPSKHQDRDYNKCVYQSLKPTYYIKGFKSVLIPVDVLYPKTKQEELFKNIDSASLPGPDLWRTDLKVLGLNRNQTEEKKTEIPVQNSTWTSVWNPDRSFRKDQQNLVSSKLSHTQSKDLSLSSDHIRPDKSCDGEVTLFVLENSGNFRRIPSDPFLPPGLRLSYSILRNFMFIPTFISGSHVDMSYVTGKNGDLIPISENHHKVIAEEGGSVSFMLSKNGGMFPVKELKNSNRSVSYYFKDNLVHRSQQFMETFSNSTSMLINNKRFQIFERVEDGMEYEPLELNQMITGGKEKGHHLRKRSTYFTGYDRSGGNLQSELESPVIMRRSAPMVEYHNHGSRNQPGVIARQDPTRPFEVLPQGTPKYSNVPQPSPFARGRMYPNEGAELEMDEDMDEHMYGSPPLRPRTDIFIFDEKGTRIRLIPEITDNNDVVIFKLTCKGNLVRYPPCKEPEFGFNICFQLLLDEFVLVPTVRDNQPYDITFVLQENGDLTPAEGNMNTFRKAPGSLIYFMLGKNNVLFPVQQVIDMEGNVSFYYQDFFLLKMKDSTEKPLHFTTKGSPLFAFFNGFTMITISSKPRLNPARGSNWKHLKPATSVEGPTKALYLSGPKGEMIRIAPYKNKQGATVIYELDCNGIFYRSPKDKKKCIILKSYTLLKEGILMPSNETTGYVYMMSKNGDLFPYLYPDGKIEAPLASSLKYVLCEKGILLPIKLEIIDSYICYIFRDVVIYKERVYCKSCLDRLDEEHSSVIARKPKKSSCDIPTKETEKVWEKDIKLFVNKDGEYVFYQKQNKVLKRYPLEAVPNYLKYTMGSFEVKPDGSLYQIRYQDPSERVINLMLEPNGDLLEDTRNVNKVRSQYYVLDAKGNLIAVDAKKTKKNLYFYKDFVRLCRVPVPDWEKDQTDAPIEVEEKKTLPLGKDPLGLMEDPCPAKVESGSDSRSLYIPIPLKSLTVAENPETCPECADAENKKKCKMLNDTLKQVSKGTSLPLALELELTDEIIEELKNWAANCDKVQSRRDITDDFRKYISNLNYVGPQGGHVETR